MKLRKCKLFLLLLFIHLAFLCRKSDAGPFVDPKNAIPAFETENNIKIEEDKKHLIELYNASLAAAKKYNVPQELLLAIGLVESGLWPWTLNVEGRPYFFKTKNDLLTFLMNNRITFKTSFDVGAMQINSQWAKHFENDINAMVDVKRNMDFAAWLLRTNFNNFGENWRGVSTYHTPHVSDRAVSYARKVVEKMKKLVPGG